MYFALQVEWRATYSRDGNIGLDGDLYDQLEEVSGTVECQAGERMCELPITLRQDEVILKLHVIYPFDFKEAGPGYIGMPGRGENVLASPHT